MLDALIGSLTLGDLNLPADVEADLVSSLQTAKAALFPPGPRDVKAGYDALVSFLRKVSAAGLGQQTNAFISPNLGGTRHSL